MDIYEDINSFNFFAGEDEEDFSKLTKKHMAKAAAAPPTEKKPQQKVVKKQNNGLDPVMNTAKPLVLPDHVLKGQMVLRKGENGKKGGRIHYGGGSGTVAVGTVLNKEKGASRPKNRAKLEEPENNFEELGEIIVDKIRVWEFEDPVEENKTIPEEEGEVGEENKEEGVGVKREKSKKKRKKKKKKKKKKKESDEEKMSVHNNQDSMSGDGEESISSNQEWVNSEASKKKRLFMYFIAMAALFVGLLAMWLSEEQQPPPT